MIIAAGVEDAAALAGLHARAFERPWSEAEFAKLLRNATAFGLAAPGQGFAIVWAAAGDSELLTLAVVPEKRRQGLGAALVAAACAGALLRGAGAMHLEVAADNHPARALYEKQGFAATGLRRNYYARSGGGADAVTMRRALP